MQMTKYTDYGLRVLMALAVTDEKALGAGAIAAQYRISQHHVAKIATALVAGGFVVSERGRGGGLRLARAADQISWAQLCGICLWVTRWRNVWVTGQIAASCLRVDCGGRCRWRRRRSLPRWTDIPLRIRSFSAMR